MIKKLILSSFVSVFFLSSETFARTLDPVTITGVGCNTGTNQRVCFINLSENVFNDSSSSPVCGNNFNTSQLRWYIREANGDQNNGEEIFALAMLAYANGIPVRLAHTVDGDCIGSSPRLIFVRLR